MTFPQLLWMAALRRLMGTTTEELLTTIAGTDGGLDVSEWGPCRL
jgi:hypothetical protein